MRPFLSCVLAFSLVASGSAFAPSPCRQDASMRRTSLQMGYVPDGMTPEQWKKQQEAEKKATDSKNFAAFGPQSFKSRSMQSFQKDLEKGKASHLLPVFNAKEKIKKGELKVQDIPYMQRGGAWDNSDVKGAKKKDWDTTDKTYNANASQGLGWDWSGKKERKGPPGYKASNNKKPAPPKPQTKKLFGLF